MKKIVWVNGIIGGVIVAVMMLISMAWLKNGHSNMEWGMVYGYASMIICFSFIFVAIKTYRDKYNNGTVSFGKAFLMGLYITLIASTFYVVTWLLCNYYIVPDFAEDYGKHMIQKLVDSGAPAAEIDKTKAEMAEFKEMYKNPVNKVLFTYMEIVPVGLLITLIASLIFKRKTAKA